MGQGLRFRFRVEVTAAFIAVAFLTASLISPDWIEKIFGFAPDGGDGATEWSTSFGAVVVFLAATFSARKDWRELRSAEASEAGSRVARH